MNMNDIFYRPKWTCGRYNSTKHVAIVFNTLADSEYFFKNESADVIGLVLAAGRNGQISVQCISKILNISSESIIPFFNSLLEIGLLSDTYPTEEKIEEYRTYCNSLPNVTSFFGKEAEQHFSSCDVVNTLEIAYSDAVDDCTYITSVGFELTYRCSENCLHCYNIGATRNDAEKSGRGNFNEMSLNDYKRIIDEMCDAGLVSALITGGDPFAHKDVWEILEYLYKKDIAVIIQTNGQQLVNQVDRLANLYPRLVKLSVYAADPVAHDSITRKKGSWQTTIDVISTLRKKGISVEISCVLMRPGLKSYIDLKALSESLSCRVFFDLNVTDSIENDHCATHHLRLTPEELEIVMMDPDVDNIKAPFHNLVPCKGLRCRTGDGSFCVMPDGKLIPCEAMHMVLGDLKTQSLQTIVENNFLLDKILNADESEYVECGTHDYCKCCVICHGLSYSKTGNPFNPNENNCYMAKCKYDLIRKLKQGIDVLNGGTIKDCICKLPDYHFIRMHREY